MIVFLKKCDESDWLPHKHLFLEQHISYPDCRPTDIKAETNVYDHKRSEKRSFYWIYLH